MASGAEGGRIGVGIGVGGVVGVGGGVDARGGRKQEIKVRAALPEPKLDNTAFSIDLQLGKEIARNLSAGSKIQGWGISGIQNTWKSVGSVGYPSSCVCSRGASSLSAKSVGSEGGERGARTPRDPSRAA
eukprot:3529071-Rhodomonas_salina.1